MQVPCRRAIGWPFSSSSGRAIPSPSLRAGAEIASQRLCNVPPAGETGLVKAVEIELKAFDSTRLRLVSGSSTWPTATCGRPLPFSRESSYSVRYRRRETADYRHAGPAGRGLNCAARPAAARRHRYRGNRLIYRASAGQRLMIIVRRHVSP